MASPNHACTAVTVRLDETNYHIWLFLMQHHLRGLGLLKFVDGSYPCPSQFHIADNGTLSHDNTGAYERWLEQDSSLILMITNTLSADALTLVIGCQTSMEVWLTLKKRYASVSESHIMKLKSTMQSIQKGSDSIERYLLKFKSIRDQLAAVGVNISDQDVKMLILAGLPSEYGHTRQIIRGKSNVDLEEVRSLLLSAEYEIELENKYAHLMPFAGTLAQNGMYSAMLPSTCFGQPFGMQSNLLSLIGNHGVTQNHVCPCVTSGMTNMHQYNTSPATTKYGFVTPQNTMTASTGFGMSPTSVTSPTIQPNFNMSNGNYQSMSSMGNNTFMMKNYIGTEGNFSSLPPQIGFSHQSSSFLGQNGHTVSYGNQQQQVPIVNSCNYNNVPQQNVMVPQKQFSQQNVQTGAFNDGYQQSGVSNSFSDGGYSNDRVSHPNFPNDKGANNNRSNNNNAKPRATGNFSNVIVCQICEKPGHGAWKCFQRNSQQQQGTSSSSMVCKICHKHVHCAYTCKIRKSVNLEEKNFEVEKKQLLANKEVLARLLAEMEKIKANNEDKLRKISEESDIMKVGEEERSQCQRLLSYLKQDTDKYMQQKELLLKEVGDLKQQKELFEKKWEELDEKRAAIEKELKSLREQKAQEEKLNRIEVVRLKNKRAATKDCIQREREGLAMPAFIAISNQKAFVSATPDNTLLHCRQASHSKELCQALPHIPPG